MTIQFRIPRVLQRYGDGRLQWELHGETVGQVLAEVRGLHPNVYQCMFDETGRLRQHVNLFLNDELLVAPDANDRTPLKNGDIVSVFPSVSGG